MPHDTGLMLTYLILSALMVWGLYRTIKSNPEAFSPQAMRSSFFTMGILALALLAGLYVLILLLKTAG